MPERVQVSSDEEDDLPLADRAKRIKLEEGEGSSSGDEVPLTERSIQSHHADKNGHISHDKHADSARSPVEKLKERIKLEHPQHQAAAESSSDDDTPLADRAKQQIKPESKPSPKKEKRERSPDSDYDPPAKKHKKSKHKKHKADVKVKQEAGSPKKKKQAEEKTEVWKWWEEEKLPEGTKWRTLEHQGVYFAPPYERVPRDIKFLYAGKAVALSEPAEEVATFYAKMLDHEYTSKDTFRNNFFKDWRKLMTHDERMLITDLSKCDFRQYSEYFKMKTEERKNLSKEEKQKIKDANLKLVERYGYALVDGHKQKVGNFRIEPPGLFRGRGDHPKMGMLKRRVEAEDIMINCSKGKHPNPPPGHQWKEIRHDNTVTWLASWNENIMGSVKYVMLAATSRLKGEKDWEKYEKARELHKHVDRIRQIYRDGWKSKEMRVRQRCVALYFIDKLALRAGNEKDGEETADTVGCCSLRVEHITLFDKKDDLEYVIGFDFLGKDSIQYKNEVPVEKRVFKNVKLFMENKEPADDLFDRLDTSTLNAYLKELMSGLTAKVFRTYNASITLQQQLELLTTAEMKGKEVELALAYNRANRKVAILCNHQRAAPKSHDTQMQAVKDKIKTKKKEVKEAKQARDDAKQYYLKHKNEKNKKIYEQKKKRYETLKNQLLALQAKMVDKEENKTIALGTSKLNYLDPRISVQWCLKWNVPLTKVYSKTHREKFQWAIDMVTNAYEQEGEEFSF